MVSASDAVQPGPTAPGSPSGAPGAADGLRTLAIDIGGTGLKASVLDADGAMVADRVRIPTTYPCPPETMVKRLAGLVVPLPAYDRVSVGFPGLVRKGHVVTAPHFVTREGPGTEIVDELVAAWSGFDLAGQLAARFGKPTRAANDADLQGAAVVSGVGLELVLTLGTGFGTGLFYEGRLAPHLEVAHHPFRHGETYNQQLGEAALQEIGQKRWNKRVEKAITCLFELLHYDHLFVGGGNAKHLAFDLGPLGTVVDNKAGILGGIWLWDDARGMA